MLSNLRYPQASDRPCAANHQSDRPASIRSNRSDRRKRNNSNSTIRTAGGWRSVVHERIALLFRQGVARTRNESSVSDGICQYKLSIDGLLGRLFRQIFGNGNQKRIDGLCLNRMRRVPLSPLETNVLRYHDVRFV